MEIYLKVLFNIAFLYSIVSFIYATFFGVYIYNKSNKEILINKKR